MNFRIIEVVSCRGSAGPQLAKSHCSVRRSCSEDLVRVRSQQDRVVCWSFNYSLDELLCFGKAVVHAHQPVLKIRMRMGQIKLGMVVIVIKDYVQKRRAKSR